MPLKLPHLRYSSKIRERERERERVNTLTLISVWQKSLIKGSGGVFIGPLPLLHPAKPAKELIAKQRLNLN